MGLHRTCENVLRFQEMDCGTESGGRKYNRQITISRARKRSSQSAGSDASLKVLDDVCKHEMHGLWHAKQVFVTGRDIIRNTTMLCRNFLAAHEEAVHGDDPYLLLALDCSKGYNRMDHSWLQRCLRAASTPPEILALVDCLLLNVPVLILDGVEFAPLHLASGLTQGCPASCMHYIIGVDPLLFSLHQTPLVSGVSAFVDDWSMGCQGMPALSAVSNLIFCFEQASGQKINRGKSAVIPARQLSDDEWEYCLAVWGSDIRVSLRERVLGVHMGIHASIKFDMALSVLARARTSLSLAMRVLVVNIFMYTLFSYPNRHFLSTVFYCKRLSVKPCAF